MLCITPRGIPANTPSEVDQYTRALYHFEELSGTSIINATGNEWTGTLLNGAHRSASLSGLGSALRLDGSPQYASIDGAVINDLREGTFEAMVYLDIDSYVPGHFYPILSKVDTDAWRALWEFGIRDGKLCASAAEILDLTSSNATIVPRQWAHVALTWDGQKVKIYVNRGLDCEVKSTAQPLNGAYAFKLGRHESMTTPDFYWPGSMDEVRISTIARTSFDDQYTRALYHFDELNGTALINAVANEWTGTLLNGAHRSTSMAGLGSALRLDGSPQYASIDGAVINDLSEGTFEAMVYLDIDSYVPGYFYPILSKVDTNRWLALWEFGIREGKLCAAAAGILDLASPHCTIVPRHWTHVALTWDGQKVKIYVKGALDCEVKSTAQPLSGPYAFKLGRHESMTTPDFYWPGSMDEVKISTVARTQFPMPSDSLQVSVKLSHAANGALMLTLADGVGGSQYIIEATDNFRNWIPVMTNSASTSGGFECQIPVELSKLQRYFRASNMPGGQLATISLNNWDSNQAVFYQAIGNLAQVGTMVELLGGPIGGSMSPVYAIGSGSPIIFSLGNPGFFDAGVGVVPFVVAGAWAQFQLLAWEGATKYDDATSKGQSPIFQGQTGSWDPNAVPPALPIGPSLPLPSPVVVKNVSP
jgi:hypothetical protein